MWLPWTPFPLLLPSWEDAITHLLPTGSMLTVTFSDMMKTLHWPTPRPSWDHQSLEPETRHSELPPQGWSSWPWPHWPNVSASGADVLSHITKMRGEKYTEENIFGSKYPPFTRKNQKSWHLHWRIWISRTFVMCHQVPAVQRETGCLGQRCWRTAWIWGDVTGANSCFSWMKKTFQSHPILIFHHPFFKNSQISSRTLLCIILWEKL